MFILFRGQLSGRLESEMFSVMSLRRWKDNREYYEILVTKIIKKSIKCYLFPLNERHKLFILQLWFNIGLTDDYSCGVAW